MVTRAQQLRAAHRLARASFSAYTEDHAGHPLGSGMPPGAPIRADGESHRQGWMTVVRRDPCAFCGRAAGTVDHIEPQSKPARGPGGCHTWLNYTAACTGCNAAKAAHPLLEALYRRRWGRAIVPGR